jgi:RNA polymerase sigma factor (TIGR02999 family)
MRRLLIDHARKKHAEKWQVQASRNWGSRMTAQEAEDLLNLNVALDRLEKSNARYAKVVELRYFGGLSINEIADLMETSPMTVKRDCTAARAWLKQQVTERRREL